MNNKIRISFWVIALSLLTQKVGAQNDLSSVFSTAGDLNKITSGYIKPLGIGFATGIGSSWYNTASTHHTLGFDISIKAGAILVPTSDQTFDLTGLDKNLKVANNATTAPSFAGSGDGVGLSLYSSSSTVGSTTYKGQKLIDMKTPKGISNIIPTICLQGSVGLPFKTELSLRYLPETKYKGMSCSLWGIGIKHDIKQWIPVVNKLPFSLSLMVAYTKFNLDYNFDKSIVPANLIDTISTNTSLVYQTPVVYDKNNKEGFGLTSTSFMANVIISKDLLFFTPYLGLGFSQNNFNFGFNGHFPTLNGIDSVKTLSNKKLSYDVKDLNNPIQLAYNTFMPNATVGFKIKLLLLALSAQYTFQQYPSASVSVGLGLR